jgi:hypothetical protein
VAERSGRKEDRLEVMELGCWRASLRGRPGAPNLSVLKAEDQEQERRAARMTIIRLVGETPHADVEDETDGQQ